MQRAARTANTPPKSSTSVLTARIDSVIHTASAVKPFDGLGVAPRGEICCSVCKTHGGSCPPTCVSTGAGSGTLTRSVLVGMVAMASGEEGWRESRVYRSGR